MPVHMSVRAEDCKPRSQQSTLQDKARTVEARHVRFLPYTELLNAKLGDLMMMMVRQN